MEEDTCFTGMGACHDSYGKPFCPKCGSYAVVEQGYPEGNHRHYCTKCNVVYSIGGDALLKINQACWYVVAFCLGMVVAIAVMRLVGAIA